MRDTVSIGLPSKGRLKESALNLLRKNNIELISKGGDRDYFASLNNLPNIKEHRALKKQNLLLERLLKFF